jgi:hypothetical protein
VSRSYLVGIDPLPTPMAVTPPVLFPGLILTSEEEHGIIFCTADDPYNIDSPVAGQHFTPRPPRTDINLHEIRTNFIQANFHGLPLGSEGDVDNTQDDMMAGVNAKDNHGLTPLQWACIEGSSQVVKELPEH